MKRGLWILAALAMTVAACGIAGWPDWQDWRRTQVLNESRPNPTWQFCLARRSASAARRC